MWEYKYTDELYHYGVKGQKWGVRRYQDENGRLKRGHEKRYGEWPPKGQNLKPKKKTYLNADESLTPDGKKRIEELNKLDQKDNRDRSNLYLAERNVERFKNGKDITSKILTKLNEKHVSNFKKSIEENDTQIKQILKELKDQKVDMVIRYDPSTDKIYYKQSDEQRMRANG